MELSKKDRIILYNQYEILKRLDTDNAELYEEYQGILQHGFEYLYDDIGSLLDEVPCSVSEKVNSILEMFMCMTFSFDKLQDTTGLDREDYMFSGFDGNEEVDYYRYAKWLITHDRYSEFKNCEFNSHWHILPRYEEMLERYNEVIKKKEKGICSTNLSADELNYIIDKK